jgi:glyoxylase-like metal-dependent hydrolase (beta-lactamase superfamily II)
LEEKAMFPIQVNDNLWVLGNDYFHIYLIRGRYGSALVETGVSATADLLLEQLAMLGAKPDFLIVTHPHSDHITGLDPLRGAFPRSTVMAAKGAESFLNHPRTSEAMLREDIHMTEFLASHGMIARRRVMKTPPSLSGCKVVNDAGELDLGGLTLRFLDAKGHSPGNILVHIPGMKALLVSDSLGNLYPGKGFFPIFFTGYSDYLATIDSLAALDPMILGLGHNGMFTGREEIREVFREARKNAESVKSYVIRDTRDDEAIARALFRFYYCDELTIYSPENILNCCRLLVRRCKEF